MSKSLRSWIIVLAIGFVIDIPYIVLGIVIIAVVVLILRKGRKGWKKHSAKREELLEECAGGTGFNGTGWELDRQCIFLCIRGAG